MTNEDIYNNSFIFLLHKITPALRYIYMGVNIENKPEIKLIGYYENTPTEIEKELLEDIADNIAAMTEINFNIKCIYIVTTIPFPLLDKLEYLLYARYEGF